MLVQWGDIKKREAVVVAGVEEDNGFIMCVLVARLSDVEKAMKQERVRVLHVPVVRVFRIWCEANVWEKVFFSLSCGMVSSILFPN